MVSSNALSENQTTVVCMVYSRDNVLPTSASLPKYLVAVGESFTVTGLPQLLKCTRSGATKRPVAECSPAISQVQPFPGRATRKGPARSSLQMEFAVRATFLVLLLRQAILDGNFLNMPSNSRKRAAQAESDVPSPTKRTRVTRTGVAAENNQAENISTVADAEVNGISEAKPKQSPATKKSRRAIATTSAGAEAPTRGPVDAVSNENIGSETIKAETPEIDPEPAANPKKPRKYIKTETVKTEEENTAAAQDTPKKTRKRKTTKQEAEAAEHINGEEEEATPKKPKRKRKTQEEKDAEAMPLAARTTGIRMLIGAHVSAAKGVQNSVTNCVHIGGNAFALFLKSQRKWENPPLQDEHRDGFKANCIQHGYDAARHIVPHGSYLVNLAQEDPDKAKQAYDSFVEDLHRCEALGIKLYNF
ncbi:MAG: hypothetical protein Q9225_007447, partial [Loekoesia sp. 1 TL-2023]